jgi:hypothetical protein
MHAHRYLKEVDRSRHIILHKSTSTKQVVGTNKAGRLSKQAGCQGWQAVKAGRLSKQAGCQGWQAVKAGRLSRQAGCKDRRVV